MKRLLIACFVFLLALTPILSLADASHTADANDYMDSRQIAGASTRLYKDADQKSTVLMTLNPGDIFYFEPEQGIADWTLVQVYDVAKEKMRKGWIHNIQYDHIGIEQEPYRATGVVLSQTAAMRWGPSFDAATRFTLKEGQTFVVAKQVGSWVFGKCNDPKSLETHEGYLRADLIAVGQGFVTCEESNTPAYAYPAWESKKVGLLKEGTRLPVIAILDEFYVVGLRGAAASIPVGNVSYEEPEVWIY